MGGLTHARRQRHGHAHTAVARVGEQQRVCAPQVGSAHAQRYQCVHARLGLAQIAPRGAMERPCSPGGYGRSERERDPLPVAELQGGHHRQQQHRYAQHRGHDEALQQWVDTRSGGWRRGGIGRTDRGQRGVVADRLHGGDEITRHHTRRVEIDTRLLGGVVHRRLYTVEFVELLLDAQCARSTRHTLHVEIDMIDERGHGHTRPTP